MSTSLKDSKATTWLAGISQTERDVDTIFSLVSPTLYQSATRATEKIKDEKAHPNVGDWPCSFSGLAVISNRKTLDHRDAGGCHEWYDLLVAAGTYQKAYLDIWDIGARFEYQPGTAIAVCGKLFKHAVYEWEGGERLCYAHYMRNNVLDRLHMEKSGWVNEDYYTQWMSKGFLRRRM
jgi:hypothetical protein